MHQQIRSQVKDEIALHQEQKALSIADVMAAAQVQNHIFQVGDMIDATDSATREECPLTTGDLINFAALPGEGEVAAAMNVVTSKSGSCRPGSVVQVGLTDLQEMLNAFSLRLEANMQKVHDYAAN